MQNIAIHILSKVNTFVTENIISLKYHYIYISIENELYILIYKINSLAF